MISRRPPHQQTGSIAILMPVIVITTGLVLATVFAVESGQRSSRRAGDSANALQVADAGINAAAQFLPTVPTSQTNVGPISATVGNGTYTYTATRVSKLRWNIDSLGLDQTGLKRRLKAQAVGSPVFGRPLLVRSTGNFASGAILDSFSGPASLCTKNGNLAVVTPADVAYGNQGNQANCQGTLLNNGWVHSNDGCEIPSEETELGDPIPNFANLTGSGRCPASNTKRVTPKLPQGTVAAPSTWNSPCPGGINTTCSTLSSSAPSSYTCDALNPLIAGKTYYYASVLLLNGCIVANASTTSGPANIFATNVTVGTQTGAQNQLINPPQTPFCASAYVGTTGSEIDTSAYCANWASRLQINIIGPGEIKFKNKARFAWGVINAPQGSVVLETEQLEFWGASVSNSMSASAQFTWHFDDNLLNEIGSGFYAVDNWREEGQL